MPSQLPIAGSKTVVLNLAPMQQSSFTYRL
jgi:hypothetical protein